MQIFSSIRDPPLTLIDHENSKLSKKTNDENSSNEDDNIHLMGEKSEDENINQEFKKKNDDEVFHDIEMLRIRNYDN